MREVGRREKEEKEGETEVEREEGIEEDRKGLYELYYLRTYYEDHYPRTLPF